MLSYADDIKTSCFVALSKARLWQPAKDNELKIVIDTDPGVDDAMAIFYAHAAPDIELLGLSTVFGNVYVDQATRNALFLIDMLGVNIPVARGCDKPLDNRSFQSSVLVHGAEGFGNFTDIPEKSTSLTENGPEFLVRMAKEHKGELVVCAIAPLTNIARAIQLDPEFSTNVEKIVIMGGAVDCPGNVSEFAEANIFHDPYAAQIVLGSNANILLVGLDVTLKTLCLPDDFDRMEREAPVTGGFLKYIGEFYLDFYWEVAGKEGCGLHDSTALIACTHPHLFSKEDVPVDVILSGQEAGNTHRSTKLDRPKISVCLDVEAQKVNNMFLDLICTNP